MAEIVLTPAATSLAFFVLLTLWCHGPLSPFLPAAYEPVLMAYGQLFPPLLVTAVGALCSTAVEYLNYHLYRKLLKCDAVDKVFRSKSGCRIVKPFFRYPFLTVWFSVLSPLPDWAARILAAHSGYPVHRYLAAVLLARLPRFWLLTALGLHLHLSTGTLVAITVVSVVLALAGVRRRRKLTSTSQLPFSQQPEAAMKGNCYLLLGLALAAMVGPLSLPVQERQRFPDGSPSADRFIDDAADTPAGRSLAALPRPERTGVNAEELGCSCTR
jgi:uncharacterized membrane protein YdjX (TVP38/TMEM64 family)